MHDDTHLLGAVEPLPRVSAFRRAVRFLSGRHWLFRLGAVLLVCVVLVLVFAPWIAPTTRQPKA